MYRIGLSSDIYADYLEYIEKVEKFKKLLTCSKSVKQENEKYLYVISFEQD